MHTLIKGQKHTSYRTHSQLQLCPVPCEETKITVSCFEEKKIILSVFWGVKTTDCLCRWCVARRWNYKYTEPANQTWRSRRTVREMWIFNGKHAIIRTLHYSLTTHAHIHWHVQGYCVRRAYGWSYVPVWVCVLVCVLVQLASPHPCTQCLPVLPSESSQISHGASSITSCAFPRPLTVVLGSVLELTAPIIRQQTQPYKVQGLFWFITEFRSLGRRSFYLSKAWLDCWPFLLKHLFFLLDFFLFLPVRLIQDQQRGHRSRDSNLSDP